MATGQATGLLMPKAVTGTPGIITPTYSVAEHPGYLPVALLGNLQPGVVVGAVAIPHFPRGGSGNVSLAHHIEFSTVVRSRYFYGTQTYQRIFPTVVDSADTGLPEPDDDEVWSEMAGVGERDMDRPGVGQAAAEARTAGLAHDPDRGMGETEQVTSGATGVWAIAGPA